MDTVSRIESVLFSAFVQRRRSASAVRTTLHQKEHGKISKKGTLGDDGRHNNDGAEDGYSQLTTATGRERGEWKRREPLAALSRSHRSTVRHSCEPRAGDIDFPATSLVRIRSIYGDHVLTIMVQAANAKKVKYGKAISCIPGRQTFGIVRCSGRTIAHAYPSERYAAGGRDVEREVQLNHE
jgi:hypothetical protein